MGPGRRIHLTGAKKSHDAYNRHLECAKCKRSQQTALLFITFNYSSLQCSLSHRPNDIAALCPSVTLEIKDGSVITVKEWVMCICTVIFDGREIIEPLEVKIIGVSTRRPLAG
ncbi:hypothetical protein J6590_016240 [Homalodisca vitripennis]|nr:hypothetical protein J6590_016240 [Homalodisca vitripennis]